MIKQVQGNYNPSALEKSVQALWAETDAYKKTKELRASARTSISWTDPRTPLDISIWARR